MTTIIQMKQIKPKQMRNRAVSPFDIQRINSLLNREDDTTIANQVKKSMNVPPLNAKKQPIVPTRNAQLIDMLNYKQNKKAYYSKLNISRFFKGENEFCSMELMVEQ